MVGWAASKGDNRGIRGIHGRRLANGGRQIVNGKVMGIEGFVSSGSCLQSPFPHIQRIPRLSSSVHDQRCAFGSVRYSGGELDPERNEVRHLQRNL